MSLGWLTPTSGTGYCSRTGTLRYARHTQVSTKNLYITAEVEAFVKWHAGQLTWAEALRDSRIRLDGPSWLTKAFPTWNARSMFAHIKPISGAATVN